MASFTNIFTTKILSRYTDKEYEVDVHYHYSPACKGARDGKFGPPLEPDEDAQIEIERVVLSKQPITAIDLSRLIDDNEMTIKIFDYLEACDEAAKEAAYELWADGR
jgi:hypothetical protein